VSKLIHGTARCAWLLALCVGATAAAQTPHHWSVDSAETVGAGSDVIRGQVGFPGLVLDYIHGNSPTFDLGGRLSLNYGVEGLVDAIQFEMKAQATLRLKFHDTGKVKIAGHFDPGLAVVTCCGTPFGILFPVGVQFGFPIDDKLFLNGSFDIPMSVFFANGGGLFNLPLLFGGGVEYLLERNLALTFKLALGPSFLIGSGGYSGSGTAFTLYALFGAAYKL
jgi:hypothetical protein